MGFQSLLYLKNIHYFAVPEPTGYPHEGNGRVVQEYRVNETMLVHAIEDSITLLNFENHGLT